MGPFPSYVFTGFKDCSIPVCASSGGTSPLCFNQQPSKTVCFWDRLFTQKTLMPFPSALCIAVLGSLEMHPCMPEPSIFREESLHGTCLCLGSLCPTVSQLPRPGLFLYAQGTETSLHRTEGWGSMYICNHFYMQHEALIKFQDLPLMRAIRGTV